MNNSTRERRSPLGCFPGQPTPRLYDRVVEVLRARHYSRRTEEAYVHWIRHLTLFHAGAHPRELGEGHVNTFLTHLAVKENVAASTQNQALAALLFLYGHVREQPLNRIEGVVRARKRKRLPVVLTSDEVEAVLAHLEGAPGLVCTLLYGSGLRLLEGLQLRVKDLDFGRGEITVRDGKGRKDRLRHRHHLARIGCSRSGPGRDPPGRRRATRSVILLRPICWRTDTTLEPCRSCSGTRM